MSRETQIARAVIRSTIQAHLDAGTKPTLRVLLREIVEAYNQEMDTTFNVAGFLADRRLHPTGIALRCRWFRERARRGLAAPYGYGGGR